jgi:MFS family permease
MVKKNSNESNQVTAAAAAVGTVLMVLGAAQFLMILDTSVMNVSIATVAEDIGTTVTGIQTAITLFTLVMATMMITGGKLGSIYGRRKIFSIGLVIYACGSLITALSPNLTVLLFGWSLLEGLGAALIMPAIVALVAFNVEVDGRPRAYGLIASAGAIAVAVGPLIGGACTTYFSWRYVFAGEVVIAAVIFVMARKLVDAPSETKPKLDLFGTVLTVIGLGSIVFAVLRSGEWGWVMPKEGGPSWAGLSPTFWLIIFGGIVLWLFALWEKRVYAHGGEPLVQPGTLKNVQLSSGLTMFFFQFLAQAGLFFLVPLYLSVCLGLSALETGVKLLPLSVTLLVAAIGIPKIAPNVSPRLVVRIGLLALLAGTLVLLGALDENSGAEIVFLPMLLVGLGIGALASQLGSVTVSAVSDDDAPEVGGVQNTATNLGASLGTAIAGSIMIAAVTSAFLVNIAANPAIPASVTATAEEQLVTGVPFVSDADLTKALEDANVDPEVSKAALESYGAARITGIRSALALLAMLVIAGLVMAGRIPTRQPGVADQDVEAVPTTA